MISASRPSDFQSRDEIINILEELAPPELAEPFDAGKIGLVIEGKERIAKVSTCLDVTFNVVRKAIENRTDLLIAHHTPIWTPTAIGGGCKAVLIDSSFRDECLRDAYKLGSCTWRGK